jgi:lantibiotic modifying enzyme
MLEAAERLGERIAAEAIWSGERCNWVGAEPAERVAGRQLGALTYRALSPDLYAGTAGVALFLAELHAATGSESARRTALGAMRQAISRADAIPPGARLGLFSGWSGIACAADRVATATAEPALAGAAREVLAQLAREQVDPLEFDIVSGRAGAIVALLAVSEVEHAARLGEELLEAARSSERGLSWRSPEIATRHDLTGFSHGASGAAFALLELFAATGESGYRDAAEGALEYERSWYSPAARNWPDFRQDPEEARARGERPFKYATLWCHGAPGIACCRLRAYELLGCPWAREEALTALSTTARDLEAALADGSANFSLCHGLCGNAEALRYGGAVLGDERWEPLAWRVAGAGLERHDGTDEPWPCGTHSGETPNLMLGLAGIGHFLLRLGNSETPPLVALRF